MAASTMITTRDGIGTVNSVRPCASSAFSRAQLSTSPSPRPTRAPSAEMSTASQRIAERSWRRSMPTARSNPSSRVRSLIDSDSVLAIPMRAMMIDSTSSP